MSWPSTSACASRGLVRRLLVQRLHPLKPRASARELLRWGFAASRIAWTFCCWSGPVRESSASTRAVARTAAAVARPASAVAKLARPARASTAGSLDRVGLHDWNSLPDSTRARAPGFPIGAGSSTEREHLVIRRQVVSRPRVSPRTRRDPRTRRAPPVAGGRRAGVEPGAAEPESAPPAPPSPAPEPRTARRRAPRRPIMRSRRAPAGAASGRAGSQRDCVTSARRRADRSSSRMSCPLVQVRELAAQR